MSLEQALADNTAAIRELIAALAHQAPAAPKAAKAEKAAATPPAPAPAPVEPAAPAPAPASPSEPAVDYATLQKAVFALAGKSREAAAAVAQSFGVKTFKELDASRWGEALAAVNAKLAEAEA